MSLRRSPTSPERLARFQREAKTLAALNHPNIGGIYGLEEASGVTALVLELVEGPTLADRIARGPITRIGVILGTAAYLAPEQAREKTVDRRADIWAFGCVLYEMLSGRGAFHGDDVSMTLAAVMMKEPGNRPVTERHAGGSGCRGNCGRCAAVATRSAVGARVSARGGVRNSARAVGTMAPRRSIRAGWPPRRRCR